MNELSKQFDEILQRHGLADPPPTPEPRPPDKPAPDDPRFQYDECPECGCPDLHVVDGDPVNRSNVDTGSVNYRSPYDDLLRRPPRRPIRFRLLERDRFGNRVSVEYVKRSRYLQCRQCRSVFVERWREPVEPRPET